MISGAAVVKLPGDTAGLAGAPTISPLPTTGLAGLASGLMAGLASGLTAGFPPPNDSRSRRATGASTVDEADLTNSPCSLSRARTSLLVTPSSLANSCTRALPATTSPVREATAVVAPRLGFSYDTLSLELHGVLMFFATCPVAGALEPASKLMCSTTADVSGEPVTRSAFAQARRRIACVVHSNTGCSHAPRPGRLPAASTITAQLPFSVGTATTRNSPTANSRFRHPTQVRTGPLARKCAETKVSRWITP